MCMSVNVCVCLWRMSCVLYCVLPCCVALTLHVFLASNFLRSVPFHSLKPRLLPVYFPSSLPLSNLYLFRCVVSYKFHLFNSIRQLLPVQSITTACRAVYNLTAVSLRPMLRLALIVIPSCDGNLLCHFSHFMWFCSVQA